MGGGPDKEHLLITLWDPEPKHITAEIKRRFPYFDITYVQLSRADSGWGSGSTKGVSPGMLFPPRAAAVVTSRWWWAWKVAASLWRLVQRRIP
jgi:hypothetical protein